LAEEKNKGKALKDQLEKMEAKLEDTEKTREQLAAQLRPVLLQVSCEQKAKAATELQVQKVWKTSTFHL